MFFRKKKEDGKSSGKFNNLIMGAVIGGAIGSVIGASLRSKAEKEVLKEEAETATINARKKGVFRRIFSRKEESEMMHKIPRE